MKMYLARFGRITEVEVARVTKCRVVFPNGERDYLTTGFQWYRHSRDEAKAAMIERYTSERNGSAEYLRYCEERLANAKEV